MSIRLRALALASGLMLAGCATKPVAVQPQLEGVTQQNAALVGEAAAKSRSLREEADRLTQIVARFRIAGDAGLRAAAPPVSPRPPSHLDGGVRAVLAGHHAPPAATVESREWKEF